jgi:hypothetical protein
MWLSTATTAVEVPDFDVMSVNVLTGRFDRALVIICFDDLERLEVPIMADDVGAVVRHVCFSIGRTTFVRCHSVERRTDADLRELRAGGDFVLGADRIFGHAAAPTSSRRVLRELNTLALRGPNPRLSGALGGSPTRRSTTPPDVELLRGSIRDKSHGLRRTLPSMANLRWPRPS